MPMNPGALAFPDRVAFERESDGQSCSSFWSAACRHAAFGLAVSPCRRAVCSGLRHRNRALRRVAVAIGCSAIGLLGSEAVTFASVPSCDSQASRAFRQYDLGSRFGSLNAVRTIRRCDRPYPGERIRANFFERQYAHCNDCEPVVSVQSWPACERGHSDVTEPPPGGLPLPETRQLRLRQVPALYFVQDRRLELYTGKTTLVLFGSNLASLRRAALKLRTRRGARPVVAADAALPAPSRGALQGTLRCPSDD